MEKERLFKLAGHIALPISIGLAGSLLTARSIQEWYVLLEKPFFAPPNELFAPVWTALYILMGIAAFLASEQRATMKYYWIQLGLNGLWTPLFFGFKSPILGLIDIVILLGFIVATILSFYKARKVSAYLLVPYLIWVVFAAILNLSLWLMN